MRFTIAVLSAALFCSAAMAQDDRHFSQRPEAQDAIAKDAIGKQATKPVAVPDEAFDGGAKPAWIWGPNDNRNYVLRTHFQNSGITAARLKASVDNVGEVYLNGRKVASGTEWSQAMDVDVTGKLADDDNVLEIVAQNQGGIAGAVLKLALKVGNQWQYVVTSADWTVGEKRGAAGTAKVKVRAKLGARPWGNVFASSGGDTGRVPRGVFEVQPGFKVDKMFTVPKDKLGSWVCIAFDNKGRLLASDQGNKGICRITLPAIDSDDETKVEHLDFSKCEFKPSGAQGMLYAFDSLYFSCNGGPGSGLYRARDTDGDDHFDECVRLKQFRGGGEHGPHSLRLSPDGKRIYVIAGNHTDPPFKSGEDLTNEDYSSRIPTNWGEDLLLPRMWDANGHARGKLAPGGWIASTDPDGKTWDIFSIGYRNPYDMAFNADGELFAYDADMEWDVGAPWYRPTRVVHATSGSEFGWRSGTGKWPTYYLDSLPPMINIGPGSPVGVDFGYGLKFPAKYQKALYICDWTFGTMYAIHMKPDQSTYTATKEEFVARSPLPLTDCAAGPDGALFFTIGGRGTQSELFRVTYGGDESTEPTELKDEKFAARRDARRAFERLHVRDTTIAESGVGFIRGDPTRTDRFVRYAASLMFNNRDAFSRLAGDLRLSGLRELRWALLTTAKLPADLDVGGEITKGVRTRFFNNVPSSSEFEATTVTDKLDLLRAVSVSLIRLDEPTDAEKQKLLALFEPSFPAKDSRLNRELCQMLVYLKSPTVVAKTVDLMNAPPKRQAIDMGDLLTRNAGYGRAIKNMIANQPDKDQVWYAFCLRVAETGWTPKTRADYFRWFGRAQKWAGGNSFRKFLQNIENEAYAKTSENERVMLEAVGARTPYKIPTLPKPVGPGKKWSLNEVRELAGSKLNGRNFENGKKMFAATRCILCHRFAGDGGATGPDLTQLAGRFNVDALTEAIMQPSKVVSDQYKASTVLTEDGKTISGRIVSENDDQISVLTDPEDSTKVVDIPKADIDEIVPSNTSIMPRDLLNTLNENEVLDLMAYLLSRGDQRHPMFRKKK